ncbi:MAG: hypothetical protein QXS27_00640 [Candidatus Jordarchaeaceae archaeon]
MGGRKEIKGRDSCPNCGRVLTFEGMKGTSTLYRCSKCGQGYIKSY